MTGCECSPAVHIGLALFEVGSGLLLLIIGYAAPNWADFSLLGMDINFGMFKYCANDNCVDLPDNLKNSKVDAAKAFGILGMMACTASMVNGILYLVEKKRCYLLPATVLSVVSFVLVLIVFVLMVVWTKDTTSDFGFCFGMTMSAFLQIVFAPMSFMAARRRHDCDMLA